MKFFTDNTLIEKILSSSETSDAISLQKIINEIAPSEHDHSLQIMLPWPSLLKYLGLEQLLENFPVFDSQNALFTFITSLLPLKTEKELLIRAYDQIFVECLTQIKALPQIDSSFLLQLIKEKRHSFDVQVDSLFAQSLDHYEKQLLEHPTYLMHDLILYLAWDRVCVNLAILFEHPNSNDIQSGLHILKECVLESFQHISAQGRTSPSFFRLVETLYAYQMREENLDLPTDAEWTILCAGASVLKLRENLPDVWYIDAAIVDKQKWNYTQHETEKNCIKVFTFDSPEKVKACLSLILYMIDKLKEGPIEWHYFLSPVEIICLKKEGNEWIASAIKHLV